MSCVTYCILAIHSAYCRQLGNRRCVLVLVAIVLLERLLAASQSLRFVAINTGILLTLFGGEKPAGLRAAPVARSKCMVTGTDVNL